MRVPAAQAIQAVNASLDTPRIQRPLDHIGILACIHWSFVRDELHIVVQLSTAGRQVVLESNGHSKVMCVKRSEVWLLQNKIWGEWERRVQR